jgi:hypothetical protein
MATSFLMTSCVLDSSPHSGPVPTKLLCNLILKAVEHHGRRRRRLLDVLLEWQQIRELNTTQEFVRAVDKAEFTIRGYCRLGRLKAEKRKSGRGAYSQWVMLASSGPHDLAPIAILPICKGHIDEWHVVL